MGNERENNKVNVNIKVFVNWQNYSQKRNKQGRLTLYTALEQEVTWSDGLGEILEGNGAAIEETDGITGVEAFMLAAVGSNSSLEIVFKLLEDHPAAINPYVMPRLQQEVPTKKRNHADIV